MAQRKFGLQRLKSLRIFYVDLDPPLLLHFFSSPVGKDLFSFFSKFDILNPGSAPDRIQNENNGKSQKLEQRQFLLLSPAYVVRREGNVFTGISLSLHRKGGRGYPKVGTPHPIQGRYPPPGQIRTGVPKVHTPMSKVGPPQSGHDGGYPKVGAPWPGQDVGVPQGRYNPPPPQ